MKKINLIIDFDNTIAKTAEAALQVWCYLNGWDFNDIDYKDSLLEWDFKPFNKFNGNSLKSKPTNLVPYLSMQELYENKNIFIKTLKDNSGIMFYFNFLKPMTGIFDILNNPLYRKYFNFILCTNRNRKNFKQAKKWCKQWKLRFDEYIRCDSFDKSKIGDKDSIIIDDKIECLYGTQRKLCILFGDYAYQQTEFKQNKIHGDFQEVFKRYGEFIYESDQNTTLVSHGFNKSAVKDALLKEGHYLHCSSWNVIDTVLKQVIEHELIEKGVYLENK